MMFYQPCFLLCQATPARDNKTTFKGGLQPQSHETLTEYSPKTRTR